MSKDAKSSNISQDNKCKAFNIEIFVHLQFSCTIYKTIYNYLIYKTYKLIFTPQHTQKIHNLSDKIMMFIVSDGGN